MINVCVYGHARLQINEGQTGIRGSLDKMMIKVLRGMGGMHFFYCN